MAAFTAGAACGVSPAGGIAPVASPYDGGGAAYFSSVLQIGVFDFIFRVSAYLILSS